MTRTDYLGGLAKRHDHGVVCPRPADLVPGAIIGSVDVVDIISHSDSPSFGSSPGNHGLVLENPLACAPIPAKGALGYFAWKHAQEFAPLAPG